jgi:hypothetical protein
VTAVPGTNEAVAASPRPARPNSPRPATAIRSYWGEAVVVALALLLWMPRLTGPIDLRWDAGVYYVLGTSLAAGQGYRILSEPGSPEALQYPPLLPALVALHQRVLGSTDVGIVGPWLRLSYAMLFLFYGLAILALARRYLPAGLAVAAVAMSLLQVNTLFMSDLLFTELPFALVSVLFALIAVDGPFASRPWIRETLSFVLAAAGFLLRTAGIALLVTWVLESIVRRQWRLVFIRGLLILLPVVAWQAHVMRVRGSYEYAHPAYEYQRAPYQFYNVSYAENVGPAGSSHPNSLHARTGAFAWRLTTNLCRMGKRLGEGISTSEGYWRDLLSNAQQLVFGRQVIRPSLVLMPIVALSALVIAGIGILIHRRIWLLAFILLVSIGLICTTPWPDQFQRYLMPLTPFLAIAALLALLGMRHALWVRPRRRATRTVGNLVIAGLLLLPLILQIYTASAIFYVRQREGASFVPGRGATGPHLFYYDRLWHGWEQAVAWIMQHSAPDAIVATPACHLYYLRSGRHAIAPPKEQDRAGILRLLESVPVSFVIVDRGYSLSPFDGDAPGWRLVQSFDGTRLYEHTGRPQ